MHSDSLNNQPAGSPNEPAQIPATRLNKREEIAECYDEGMLFLSEPEYDEAILGVARRFGQEEAVAYDADKVYGIIGKLLDTDDITVIYDYFQYNIIGAYVGERTPVFVDVV